MKYTQMTPDSSLIESYEYDYDELTLLVTFKDGKEYLYSTVGADTLDSLKRAPSVGNFFATEIKKFPCVKLEGASTNPPKAWKFPKAEDFKKPVSDAVAAWPFPTGNKPV